MKSQLMQSIDVFSVRNNAPRSLNKSFCIQNSQRVWCTRDADFHTCMCLSMCMCVSHVWNLLNLVEARILFFYTKALFFGLCVYLVYECISVCLFQLLSSCWIIHIKQYAMVRLGLAWLGLVLGLSRTRSQQNALYYFYTHREWIINVYISAAFWNNLSLGLRLGLLKQTKTQKQHKNFL